MTCVTIGLVLAFIGGGIASFKVEARRNGENK